MRPLSFPRGATRHNYWGECIAIEKQLAGSGPGWLGREGAMERVAANLKLVRGIGPVTQSRLHAEGYADLYSLRSHPKWGPAAGQTVDWIEARDWSSLLSRKASDLGLLGMCDPERTVFLDIETTGLTASAPLFMVGMLLPVPGGFKLCQMFARDYDEETAVLEETSSMLASAHAVVTFNGRCFDMPYISRRLAYYGRDDAFRGLVVDLLAHARRAFRSQLPDCRLATIQTTVLKTPRENDIPGYMIPEVYQTFVRTGDARLVLPIIDHNELDLIAMADLLPLLA